MNRGSLALVSPLRFNLSFFLSLVEAWTSDVRKQETKLTFVVKPRRYSMDSTVQLSVLQWAPKTESLLFNNCH